jgi:glyoxylase-like metal-dependent hydrolase (beta-lactamase superfamily II)
MSWLNLKPEAIEHILITYQDTDHIGAVERDSELLFKHARIYIGEIENRYLTGEVRRKVFRGLYKLPKVKTDNERTLLKDGQVIFIYDIKIECILVPGHTWGHLVYLIDDKYLFTGDTIWFGADGGYSFLSALAEDNQLSLHSLARLEKIIRGKQSPIKIITGHTGYTDDLDFAFTHIDKVCSLFSKRVPDPSAPFDGYVESDDTEENAKKQCSRL